MRADIKKQLKVQTHDAVKMPIMCAPGHVFTVLFVILASEPLLTVCSVLQKSDSYYDEELYYIENDAEAPASFAGDLQYANYDEQRKSIVMYCIFT